MKTKPSMYEEKVKQAERRGTAARPAKLTRPRLGAVYQRSQLIEKLGHAFDAPAVWIEAQPGAGKTTLAASWLDQHQRPCLWYQVDTGDADLATFFHYLRLAAKHIAPRYKQALPHLTPEYLFGIETYARRFFEELFRRMPQGSVMVLDNLQDAGVESPLHNILRIAIETLPAHVKMLCISRVTPHAALARLRTNGQLAVLEPVSIRLNLEEAQGIASLRGHTDQVATAVIHNLTNGWVAGLVLMLESNATTASNIQDTQSLFNYFASEVLLEMDEARWQALVKSSLLPKMRVGDVQELTGHAEAGKMLADLHLRNYFTYRLSPREAVYEYHPLFREFLLTRLHETFDQAELARLRSEAAKLLDEAGQFEDAAALWSAAHNWTALVPHIMKHTPRLLAEGRMQVVETWLAALPAKLADAQPWLLYWKGACQRALNPALARSHFERAFALFESTGDLIGQYESWASLVDTFNYEWMYFQPLDHWIAVMDKLVAGNPIFPSPEIKVRVAAGMLNALHYRQPARADMPQWAEILESFILTSGNSAQKLMLGFGLINYLMCVTGNFPRAAVILDALRSKDNLNEYDPLSRQFWYVMMAVHSWIKADWEACRKAVYDGLMNAKVSGVHILDAFLFGQGIYGGLTLGDIATAQDCLDRMSQINSPRLGDKGFFHYQAASLSWYRGDFKKSVEHGKQALKIAEEDGWLGSQMLTLTELAVTLFDDGQHDEADACLARSMEIGHGMDAYMFPALINGAIFAFERDRQEHGRALLERGLAMGKQMGFVNMPRWHNGRMSKVLAKALEHGIEIDYALGLIRKRKLDPPEDMPVPELWPYPVKIHTLGGFAILKDGHSVQAEGKVQKRTLELLKALIAFGGSDVSEQRLCDALWAESEADAARANLKVTLHRLRGLMGQEALVLRESKLSLDLRRCRVDVFEFEKIANSLAASSEQMSLEELNRAGTAMTELYRGTFLPDDESVFALSARERLRVKWLRAVVALAEGLQRHGAHNKALAWYECGLESEPLAEPLYRGLMRALLSLRRPAEGIAAYERCRKELAIQLHATPSAETDALARALRTPIL